MTRILSVLAAVAVALALVAGAVALGDDRTVVPAPEVVAEGFIRQLLTKRYAQTQQYFSDSSRRHASTSQLKARSHELSRVGAVYHVEATPEALSGRSARVAVRVRGSKGRASVRIDLIRERGLWKIARLPR